MGKLQTLLLGLLLFTQVSAQKYSIKDVPGRPGAKEIIIPVENKKMPVVMSNLNMLDANPAYRKPAKQFIAFQMLDSSTGQPINPDKVIELPAEPGQRPRRTTVGQILKETNAMEQALCIRGHSLREDNPFEGLKMQYKFDRNAPPVVNIVSKGGPTTTNIGANTGRIIRVNPSKNEAAGRIKISQIIGVMANNPVLYWSYPDIFNQPKGEFGHVNHELFGLNDPFGFTPESERFIIIGMPADTAKLFSHYAIEVVNPNNNSVVATVLKSINQNDLLPLNNIFYDKNVSNVSPNANWQYLRINAKDLNLAAKLGEGQKEPVKYVLSFRLKKLVFLERNKIRAPFTSYEKLLTDKMTMLYSCQQEITMDRITGIEKKEFNYRKTDPSGIFGFFMKSNGFKTKYSSTFTSDNNCRVINSKGAKVEADISLGVVTYNFLKLVNSSLPSYDERQLFGASFTAVTGVKTGANGADEPAGAVLNYTSPQTGDIRIPLGEGPLKYSVPAINYPVSLFNQSFFIGPVPCQITVDLNNSITVDIDGAIDNTNKTISGSFTPKVKSTVTGKGEVDAVLLYANIIVNVNVVEMAMKHDFNASQTTTSNRSMDIEALGGDVTFNAGFYYPCGKTFWTGEFCKKNFPVEIFRWNGPRASIPF